MIDAAIQLFARKGYESTSMKDIAAAVGVKAPVLCNHFASKDDVFVEAIEGVLERLFAAVLAPLENFGTEDWLEQIVRRNTIFQIEQIDVASANDLIMTGENRSSHIPDAAAAQINQV